MVQCGNLSDVADTKDLFKNKIRLKSHKRSFCTGEKMTAKFLIFALCFATAYFISCKDPKEISCPDPEETPLPDPEGTIEFNVGELLLVFPFEHTFVFQNVMDIHEHIADIRFVFSWTSSNHIQITCSAYYPEFNQSFFDQENFQYLSICSVGKVKGLGNITKIPASDCTNIGLGKFELSFSYDAGYGYVIKTNDDFVLSSPTYVRMYIVGPVVNSEGDIIGAKIKYQYPFVPLP